MSDVRYSYLHGPRRHVTIARSIDLEKNLVHCGISVCHPVDVFRKALGREIAKGRLEKNNSFCWAIALGDTKPLEAIMSFLIIGTESPYEYRVPTCVKELAQEWQIKKERPKS